MNLLMAGPCPRGQHRDHPGIHLAPTAPLGGFRSRTLPSLFTMRRENGHDALTGALVELGYLGASSRQQPHRSSPC
jgi:hypothetical protein